MLIHAGADLRTEYDARAEDGKYPADDDGLPYVDPPSKDATMMIIIDDPDAEPAIHRSFPGGLEDLEEYRREVVDGIKDSWIADENNPEDKRWHYTYHDRFTAHFGHNQLAEMAVKLAKAPHSRRSQAVTCDPVIDKDLGDPPCLQSFWARVSIDADGIWWLCVNTRMRSWDAYGAAFMNLWAFAGKQGLQGALVEELRALTGKDVRCGRYVGIGDSYHVYGSDLAECHARFVKQLSTRTFEERTWTRDFAQAFFEESRIATDKKLAEYAAQRAAE
jgi:thymidylate synthase